MNRTNPVHPSVPKRPSLPLGLRLMLAVVISMSFGFEWEGSITRLQRQFETGDVATRRMVVRRLAEYPAADVDAIIIVALQDADSRVRSEAAHTAGQTRLLRAVPLLSEWLNDPDADIRAAAAQALGRIGVRAVIPNLVRVLGDSDRNVRRAALNALAAIGSSEITVPVLRRLDDNDQQVQVEAAGVLGQLGDARAVIPLIGRARDDAPEVRAAVYSALGELGDTRASAALVQGLRDNALNARLAAIAALGQLDPRYALGPLSSLLNERNARVLGATMIAIGQLDGPEAHRLLLEAIGTPHRTRHALRALRERARRTSGESRAAETSETVTALADQLENTAPNAIGALFETLRDLAQFVSIRESAEAVLRILRSRQISPAQALETLGLTGDPGALIPLLEYLGERDRAVREAALRGLSEYFRIRGEADGRAADPLLETLNMSEGDTQVLVVRLLGETRAVRALPTLRELLDHPNVNMRLTALRAIRSIGSSDDHDAIYALLHDRNAEMRFQAAQTLGAIASQDDLTQLLSSIQEPTPIDRHALLIALRHCLIRLNAQEPLPPELHAQTRAVLEAAITHPDDQLAARALNVLEVWPDVQLLQTLIANFDTMEANRANRALHVFAQTDSQPALQTLRNALSHPVARVRTQAASLLGEVSTEPNANALLDQLTTLTWPTAAAASFGLLRMARQGHLDAVRALPVLCEALETRAPLVRANIALTLAHFQAPPCDNGVSPLDWLDNTHHPLVRMAAARWAAAAMTQSHLAPNVVQNALNQCANDLLSPAVSAVCARPTQPEHTDFAEVYSYNADGSALLRNRLVALQFADGSVWITYSDANGRLALARPVEGPILMHDPATIPLDP